MRTTCQHSWLWVLVAVFVVPLVYGQETILVANFMNGNSDTFNSRVYLWNASQSAGDVTVRVFTLPLSSGTAQELTTTPLGLGTLGAKAALNIKLAEDILTPLGIPLPYTTDGGNLTLEFTIGALDVRGSAQVFSSNLAFGTYPLQVIPSTSSGSPTVLVATFMNGNDAALNSRICLWNPSANPGSVTGRVYTLEQTGVSTLLGTVDLGSLEGSAARNIKLAENILLPLGIPLPYTADGGNLTLEFTVGAENVRGVAQVFSSDLAFGTYPLEVIKQSTTVNLHALYVDTLDYVVTGLTKMGKLAGETTFSVCGVTKTSSNGRATFEVKPGITCEVDFLNDSVFDEWKDFRIGDKDGLTLDYKDIVKNASITLDTTQTIDVYGVAIPNGWVGQVDDGITLTKNFLTDTIGVDNFGRLPHFRNRLIPIWYGTIVSGSDVKLKNDIQKVIDFYNIENKRYKFVFRGQVSPLPRVADSINIWADGSNPTHSEIVINDTVDDSVITLRIDEQLIAITEEIYETSHNSDNRLIPGLLGLSRVMHKGCCTTLVTELEHTDFGTVHAATTDQMPKGMQFR